MPVHSSVLSPVLDLDDFPQAELDAARLDGEVYRLGAAYCVIDELEGPRHRAIATLTGRPGRFVAELETAAWIWGAVREPKVPRFAVSARARARLRAGAPVPVREVVYAPGDVARLAGRRVTTPLRTTVDLARAAPGLPSDELLVALRALAVIGRFSLDDCRAVLSRGRGFPHTRRALALLERVLA